MAATISSAATTARRPMASSFSPAGAPWKAMPPRATTPCTVRSTGSPLAVLVAMRTTAVRPRSASASARLIRKISLRMLGTMRPTWYLRKIQFDDF